MLTQFRARLKERGGFLQEDEKEPHPTLANANPTDVPEMLVFAEMNATHK